MKNFILIFVLFFSLTPVFLAEYKPVMKDFVLANQYYDSSKYEEALELYLAVLESEHVNEDIHLNLGNTYFKVHQYGKAVYHYEKYLKAHPNNKAVLNNLEITRERLADSYEKTRVGFFSWIASFIGYTYDFWAVLGLLALFFSLIAYVFAKQNIKAFYIKVANLKKNAFFLLFFLFTGLASIKYWYANSSNLAVLLSPTASLKEQAEFDSPSIKLIHEGAKFVVLEEKEQWIKIRVGSAEGWIEKTGTIYGVI